MERKPYSSDLSDAEWVILKPLLPTQQPVGSPRQVALREVINALLYVSDNGIFNACLS
jgi:putative transposase